MSETIGTMLGQVSRLLRRSFDERARSMGATRPQWQVLSLLDRYPGINQGGLSDLLEVEPITTGRMIDRLQDAELVERRADPADRRAWRLHLTPKGEELLLTIRPMAVATLNEALEGIDEADRAQLMMMLDKMRTNLARKPALEPSVGG
jgi:DNA-binding MarR family transcriptional regulator